MRLARKRDIQPEDVGLASNDDARSKFNVKIKRVIYEGLTFASEAQLYRWKELRKLEEAGEIFSLTHEQPSFVLQPAFRDLNGKWYAAITYTLDLCYRTRQAPHVFVIEDVKGMLTQQGNMRIKMLRYHLTQAQRTDIKLRIVDKYGRDHGKKRKPKKP